MKSARILVIGLMILLMGYGVSATFHAWGQDVPSNTNPGVVADLAPLYNQANPQLSLQFRSASDVEMDKLLQEEATAERQVVQWVDSYAHSEGEAQRSKVKSNLATALAKEFDLQQKRRDLELARVEARLKKVRELMQKRTEARQSIIEKRLDQLLREADGLGWTPPAGIHLRGLDHAPGRVFSNAP